MASQAPAQRVIRVFISSTFRDMHAERDELVKYVFPQLRALCESRGVVWGEVDLRWGITDEEKAEGKVLPLCLEEINNCRPYFIGLLGERYGWVPDEIPAEIIEREPWLKDHLKHSVTELEILQGVFRNPEMADHAFFYFRDPFYVERLPEKQRKDFIEEDTQQIEKLHSLKNRIRGSRFPVRENYPDPKALGELVLKDMTSVINKLFPEGSAPNPLDRDALEHEQFAKSRAAVYIGRKEYFDRLDEHARRNEQPLAVLGESGSGKSALLSTWALKYKEMHPDELVIMHFIGAAPYSADWMAMLRRIMGEIKRQFDIRDEIPDKSEELKVAFANWLHMAAAKGKVVLILDALNQLEDRDAAPDLVWLPPFIPDKIRLIVSTLPGKPLDEIDRRGWKTLRVEPLVGVEKKKLTTEYLQQYSKKLTDEQQEVLANAPQTANPLYLRALLEELRLYGDHFTINERIEHYLTSVTVDDLYERILERYEQDYERERPGLVKEAMSLLWAARRGLSENELMELLGSDGQPLPHAYWSPPWLAVKESLVRRAGLLNFSHDYFRKAVSEKYIPEGNSQKAIHVQLADYFERHELTTRKVDELAWQLSNAEEWERLKICISDLQMFDALFTEEKKYELTYYWLKLGSGFDQVRAYSDAIASYEKTNPSELELAYIIRQVSQFHYLSAMYDDAEPLMHRTLNIYENHYGVNHPATAFSLNDLATLYDSKGNYNEAERLYKRAIEILEKNTESNYLDLAACLNNLALLKHNKGNYDNAEQYYERALEMYETILGPDDLYVALILSNISSVYISIIEVSAAGKSMRIPSVRKSLEELPEYVDPEEIASYAKVEPILKRSLAIREKTLGPNHTDLLSSFTNLSSVYIRMKRFDKAELLLRRALALCERTFGMQHPSTGATLYAFGDLYYSQEKFMEAVRYYSQAYDVLTKILGWKHPYAKYAFNKLALAQKLQKEQKIDQIFLFAHKVIKRLGLLPRD